MKKPEFPTFYLDTNQLWGVVDSHDKLKEYMDYFRKQAETILTAKSLGFNQVGIPYFGFGSAYTGDKTLEEHLLPYLNELTRYYEFRRAFETFYDEEMQVH